VTDFGAHAPEEPTDTQDEQVDAPETQAAHPAEPAEPAAEPVAETQPVADAEPAADDAVGDPGDPSEASTLSDADDPGDLADDEDVEVTELPALADDTALANALEALLLVVDVPANEELLAVTLEQSVARVTEMLQRMSAGYTEREAGFDLRRIGDGWRFVTRDRYAPYVEKLLLDGQRAKLTRAALETLAVIAYRQPVTRARVAAVRGVNVDGVIRTLVVRGLIAETGTDSETGGLLYRTTELFLERLGLSSLEDLPAIAPLLPEVDAIDDV
jgi:segregation and condensation protein B